MFLSLVPTIKQNNDVKKSKIQFRFQDKQNPNVKKNPART